MYIPTLYCSYPHCQTLADDPGPVTGCGGLRVRGVSCRIEVGSCIQL